MVNMEGMEDMEGLAKVRSRKYRPDFTRENLYQIPSMSSMRCIAAVFSCQMHGGLETAPPCPPCFRRTRWGASAVGRGHDAECSMAHDPRTREVPPELVALVRDCVQRRGRQGAARALGIHSATLTSIMAGLPVMPGTLSLLRDAARRRSQFGGDLAIASTRNPREAF